MNTDSLRMAEPVSLVQRLATRFRDRQRWKRSLYDLTIWFMFGMVVTMALRQYAPGYPIVVGTPSIPMGFYWVDRTDHQFSRGDYVSFDFNPTQPWLQGRYGRELVHTKIVLGVAGDVIRADQNLDLTLCHPAGSGKPASCESAGHVFLQDSKGRPLYSWVPAGHEYTLREGELWVFGNHPRSLDSRYHGPVLASATSGKAAPLWQF